MTKMEAQECIARWIAEIHTQHPTWEQKQVIVDAYAQCGAIKGDFEGSGFCPYKVFSKLLFAENFAQSLYSDFSGQPVSVQIANAVDLALPYLRNDFPNIDEIELLKLAYKLAQKVVKGSDFQEIAEEPIYFAITIPNSELPAFENELRVMATYLSDEDFTDDAKDPFFAAEQGVTSSNVAEVGYDNGKLRIFFNNGGGYEYPVPSSWYLQMMAAPSKGQFVWDTLRGRVPGRVIDNPNKITPGGVGGSIVPYFKIKGAQMSQYEMAASVRGFLKAAKKGTAEVGGTPIQQIDKPTFKAFDKFVKQYDGGVIERLKRVFQRFMAQKSNPANPTPPKAPSPPTAPIPPNPAAATAHLTGLFNPTVAPPSVPGVPTPSNLGSTPPTVIQPPTPPSRAEKRKAEQREFALQQAQKTAIIHFRQDRHKELSSEHEKILNLAKTSFAQAYEEAKRLLDKYNTQYFKDKSISQEKYEDEAYILGELVSNLEGLKEKYPDVAVEAKTQYTHPAHLFQEPPQPEPKEEPAYIPPIKAQPQAPAKTPTEAAKKATPKAKPGRALVRSAKRPFQQKTKIATPEERIAGKIRAAQSYSRRGKESKYEPEAPAEKERITEQKDDLRLKIKDLRKRLKAARESNSESTVKTLKVQIQRLEKELEGISDFTLYTDDFTDDMRYFRGPITRAGPFQYGLDVKTKDLANIKEVAQKYRHLPTFDSHQESQILGFAYNFTDDPDLFMKDHPAYKDMVGKQYLFSEGYAFNDIEDVSEISIISDQTRLPVSIRFFDANEGTGSPDQRLSDLLHLAISVNATDQDRCSTLGGDPCYVTFHDRRQVSTEEHRDDFIMPEDKNEKKPPLDEDEEEEGDDSEEDPKKKASDKKDFEEVPSPPASVPAPEEDFIKISKADFTQMRTELNEIKESRKQEIARAQAMELQNIKNDFKSPDKVYKIKADFLKTANIDAMRTLKGALELHEGDIKPLDQMFGGEEDFDTRMNRLDENLKKIYGVAK